MQCVSAESVDDDLGVGAAHAVVGHHRRLDVVLEELPQQLQRDVRDDLDVHPRVVVDLEAHGGVDVGDVPPALELVVAVHALDHLRELAVAALGHADPHLRDRVLRAEPRLALGLGRDRVVDDLLRLGIEAGLGIPVTSRSRTGALGLYARACLRRRIVRHPLEARPVSAPQLRPLGIGEILDVGMKIAWRNAGTLIRAVVFVVLPVQILSTVILLSSIPDGFEYDASEFGTSGPDPGVYDLRAEDGRRSPPASACRCCCPGSRGLLATGACYRAIVSAYLGERTGWRESLGYALRRAHSILWVTILVGVISVLGFLALHRPRRLPLRLLRGRGPGAADRGREGDEGDRPLAAARVRARGGACWRSSSSARSSSASSASRSAGCRGRADDRRVGLVRDHGRPAADRHRHRLERAHDAADRRVRDDPLLRPARPEGRRSTSGCSPSASASSRRRATSPGPGRRSPAGSGARAPSSRRTGRRRPAGSRPARAPRSRRARWRANADLAAAAGSSRSAAASARGRRATAVLAAAARLEAGRFAACRARDAARLDAASRTPPSSLRRSGRPRRVTRTSPIVVVLAAVADVGAAPAAMAGAPTDPPADDPEPSEEPPPAGRGRAPTANEPGGARCRRAGARARRRSARRGRVRDLGAGARARAGRGRRETTPRSTGFATSTPSTAARCRCAPLLAASGAALDDRLRTLAGGAAAAAPATDAIRRRRRTRSSTSRATAAARCRGRCTACSRGSATRLAWVWDKVSWPVDRVGEYVARRRPA